MDEVNFAVEVGNAICAGINSLREEHTEQRARRPFYLSRPFPVLSHFYACRLSSGRTDPLEFDVTSTSVGPIGRDVLTGRGVLLKSKTANGDSAE